jgi:hypothetical protein
MMTISGLNEDAPPVAPVAAPSFYVRYKKALLVGGAIALSAIGIGVALFVKRKRS